MTDITWPEYVDAALRTAPDQSAEMQLVQGVLGAIGEIDELMKAIPPNMPPCSLEHDRIDEEIGDAMWYLALAYSALGRMGADAQAIDWPTGRYKVLDEADYSHCSVALQIMATISNVAEKVAFQGEGVSSQKADALSGALKMAIEALAVEANQPPPDIWAANIEKLKDRHPDGAPGEVG